MTDERKDHELWDFDMSWADGAPYDAIRAGENSRFVAATIEALAAISISMPLIKDEQPRDEIHDWAIWFAELKTETGWHQKYAILVGVGRWQWRYGVRTSPLRHFDLATRQVRTGNSLYRLVGERDPERSAMWFDYVIGSNERLERLLAAGVNVLH